MPSASIKNTTPYTTYTMRVQAQNVMGKGPISGPVSAQFNCAAPMAEISADKKGIVTTYSEGGIEHVQHEIHTTEQIEVVTAGFVETLIILAGGGGGGGTDADGSSYAGGSGGAGGSYYKKWYWLEPQVIYGTIGQGGSPGGNRSSGGRGTDTSILLDGVTIVCGGGGGGKQMYGADNTSGRSGSNGGGNGGKGGGASSPGVGAGTGESTLTNLYLNNKKYGTSRVGGQNTGNGQGSPKSAGYHGVFLIRYPIMPEAG